MDNLLTTLSKRIGDLIAQKTKDADNALFAEISENVIDEFVKQIREDNPVLASWVEDWMAKNENKSKKKITNQAKNYYGGCGGTSSGCGYSLSYSSGGCGSSNGRC